MNAQATQPGTRIMVRAGSAIRSIHSLDLHNLNQKSRELVSLFRQCPRLTSPLKIVTKQFRILLAQGISTRARGRHNVITVLECPDNTLCDLSRAGLVTAVQCGLATTSLGLRHRYSTTRLFQQMHRGKGHLGADQVGQASDKKANAR